ncbi:MAG TPA: cupin domain-containing protein [Bryobacteraceae bacterium]|jgi:anti-sigma factor ChrR (cupin superfamily)
MKTSSEARECSAAAALYALGALPAEEETQFERRLRSACPLCTALYNEYAAVAEQLAASVPETSPAASVRARLLKRIAPAAAEKSGMRLLRASDSPWIPIGVPGVEVRLLDGKKTLLVRMQPGSIFPEHEHKQVEQCYVIEGSVTDSDGMTAHAGDFVSMPAGITHRPIHSETGCVFLIAYTN